MKTSRSTKDKPRNKKKKYTPSDYAIIVFTTMLIILSIIGAFNSFVILEETEFQSLLIVYDHYGFDINTTVITFGMVTPGGSSTRTVIAENKYPFPVEIQVIPRGEISKFVSRQSVILNTNAVSQISLSAQVPKETQYGNYTGTISMVVKRYLFKK